MKTRMSKRSSTQNTIFASVVMFGLWSLVSAQSPFYLDDWGWGMYKLVPATINYGGRFIGNSFEIILASSHNQILNGLFKGAVLTFICLMVCLISGKISLARIVIFNTLFLLTSMRIIYESFIWTAGFVNYTLPFVFVLPVVLINQRLKKQTYSKRIAITLKIISLTCIFASGFFLENLSTTMIFYLGTEFILNLIFERKNRLYSILAIVTSMLSFVIMMLHSERFTNKDGYSMNSFNSIGELIQNAKNVHLIIINDLFHNNTFLFMFISSLFFVFLITVLLKLTDKKERFLYQLTIIQVILIFLCPTYQFIILSPSMINDRVFFPSIIVLILSGLILYNFIEKEVLNQKFLNCFVGFIFVCSLIFPTFFFVDMSKWNVRLNEANEKAITQKMDIDYSGMRPEYHVYYYNDAYGPVIASPWINAYKIYYKIPEEVTIK
ncbi:hypothetical protein Hs30E_09640 [Lactococcus hodotermopsidis]|uniref:Glucosyltransferase n=1 Tax=Pseudolactococcus hodotermopsidis TaxID=2709157 RepID=A0A6A0BCH9_9LACT|nr:DUF6056 family protein [Lactococcus hodotermopsidis]GFH42413.1 hypothetical protein Hs30E_09640 [Lactococcus hodotermopsidis]